MSDKRLTQHDRYQQFLKRFHSDTPEHGVCWLDSRLDEFESWFRGSFQYNGEYTIFCDDDFCNLFVITLENGVCDMEDCLKELFGEFADVEDPADFIDILSFILDKPIYIGIHGEYRKARKLESIYTEKDLPLSDRIEIVEKVFLAIEEAFQDKACVSAMWDLIVLQRELIKEMSEGAGG